MAKIAIIGSSFSKCLYSVANEPDMSNWSLEEREKWASEVGFESSIMLENYEKHWVNLLAKKYPQHEFHIFAKGGAGWEFAEIVLHRVAELKFDRVIVELQEPRLMLYNRESSSTELMLNDNYLEDIRLRSDETSVFNYPHIVSEDLDISHACFKNQLEEGSEWDVKKQVKTTVQWQSERHEQFNRKLSFVYTDDIINYIVMNVKGPVYATRYRQFLLSLKNVWPKVFNKVGFWAYLPINMPWSDLDLHADIFGDELRPFEDTAADEWIKKDPINNSFETWQNMYCGPDREHLNKEGMPLLVDFLLKQPSIQKVFE